MAMAPAASPSPIPAADVSHILNSAVPHYPHAPRGPGLNWQGQRSLRVIESSYLGPIVYSRNPTIPIPQLPRPPAHDRLLSNSFGTNVPLNSVPTLPSSPPIAHPAVARTSSSHPLLTNSDQRHRSRQQIIPGLHAPVRQILGGFMGRTSGI